MKTTDYEKELERIIDLDIEISSIADCRKAMSELNEREDILIKIRAGLKKDIRSVESRYLKKRAFIREKYDSKGSTGIIDSLKGPFAATRIKEMKKLEKERTNTIESYHNISYRVEDLLLQVGEIQDSVKTMMKEMLGNY
jgi:hypothetical protein